ncbi:DNA2/NAM7 helicase-like, C-terminal [Dillenia turbinata]|uniref:DNA2/NAM7 helicase-like, C-terminal n=1 Tax=Dillenia turbinata TaxID=194707 RepID=A0AAN8YW36_9MAGN
MSLYNECEADAAVELLKGFKRRYPSEFAGGRIGIITPSKRQLSFLRSWFSNAFGSSITADREFNTVDGFQGREVDVLLLSMVRAADTSSDSGGKNPTTIGFVADIRRMNFASTIARLSLWNLETSEDRKIEEEAGVRMKFLERNFQRGVDHQNLRRGNEGWKQREKINQKQTDLGNSLHKLTSENQRTHSDRSEYVHDNSKGSKSQILKVPTASSECHLGKKNVIVSNPSSGGSHKDSSNSSGAPK